MSAFTLTDKRQVGWSNEGVSTPEPPDLLFVPGYKPSSRWSIEELIVYARWTRGTCRACWQVANLRSCEIAYRVAREPQVTHWTDRLICEKCILILRSACQGKITYCAF